MVPGISWCSVGLNDWLKESRTLPCNLKTVLYMYFRKFKSIGKPLHPSAPLFSSPVGRVGGTMDPSPAYLSGTSLDRLGSARPLFRL